MVPTRHKSKFAHTLKLLVCIATEWVIPIKLTSLHYKLNCFALELCISCQSHRLSFKIPIYVSADMFLLLPARFRRNLFAAQWPNFTGEPAFALPLTFGLIFTWQTVAQREWVNLNLVDSSGFLLFFLTNLIKTFWITWMNPWKSFWGNLPWIHFWPIKPWMFSNIPYQWQLQ